MRRPETLLALAAVVLASVSVLQVLGSFRLLFALLAMLLLCIVISSRLRAALRGKQRKPGSFNAYDRAMKIQRDRSNRLDR